MKIMKKGKLNSLLIGVLLALVLLGTSFLFGCDNGGTESNEPCLEHSFERVEDPLNREPTYDRDGRELRKCSVCGVTASFVLPKLEKISGVEEEGYMNLLDQYTVSYGDRLGEIASRYFTPGWSFLLDKETFVGDASPNTYDYRVVYTPSSSKYEKVERTVKIKVNKAVLQENDLLIEVALDIPITVSSLEEIPIGLQTDQAISGTIRWVENQEILRNQVAYYNYVFTPTDTDNYEVFYGKVLLKG